MKKSIDYGKLISLHNAGWSGDKIAEELKPSREEYDKALTDLLDRLDAKIMLFLTVTAGMSTRGYG